ncbi:spore coat protein [Virgibacillus alimentarius]|uniref:Spore coat protein X n=1 Tax=Virgibacillus alimentarius TaxID=698769 RepID=A0ABS4SBB9_9BACI|nr:MULTISPECIES: spore coat protein [Virgibacillus]MBP2258647.1 spore coat protein X [Virgibacillus alimentarius]HLR66603.1 spore coat protein [Virgibacillus sp.]
MTSYRRYNSIPSFNNNDRYFYDNPAYKCDQTCDSSSCSTCQPKPKKWRALDYYDKEEQNDSLQEAKQSVSNVQESTEWVVIKDSECIDVTSTDTQVAVSLQLALQVAIEVVLRISLGDSAQVDKITQRLKEKIQTKQGNRQKTIIENSKNVEVTTMDTDVAISIQLLLQILVAIVASLDIL